jgi:putative transposase
MTRKISFAPGEYYHVYNRGVDKRNIFPVRNDYERFVALLYLCNNSGELNVPKDFSISKPGAFSSKRKETLVDINAYCLMPNHFHILLREKEDGGVSAFMQKLSTAYTMYFNKRNNRTGALFQGTFKAEHVDNDRYMQYLIAYIHLNPVRIVESGWKETGIKEKKKTQEFLDKYTYSSYLDFNGMQRPQNSILTPGSLPEYFATPVSFRESVKEFIEYKASLTEDKA